MNDWFHTLSGAPLKKKDTDAIEQSRNLEELQPQVTNIEGLPADLVLIPNPANDFTELYIDGFDKASKEVMMFDLNGKLIFRVKVDADQNNLGLDLDKLNVQNGIYLIRVTNGVNQKTEKLMIER